MVTINIQRLTRPLYYPFHIRRLWFVILLLFGIILLLCQLYVIQNRLSIIEGLETSDSTSPPLPTTNDIFVRNFSNSIFNLDIFKNIFKRKCLAGCRSPTEKSTTECKISNLGNSRKKFYKCPWVCDIDSLNQRKKDDPIFAEQYANAGESIQECSKDHENIDCGACVPEAYFVENVFPQF